MAKLVGITSAMERVDSSYFRNEIERDETLRKLLMLNNPVIQPIMSRIFGLSEEDVLNSQKFTSSKYYLFWVMGVQDLSKVDVVLLSIVAEAIHTAETYMSLIGWSSSDDPLRVNLESSFLSAVEKFRASTGAGYGSNFSDILGIAIHTTLDIIYRSIVKNVGREINKRKDKNPDGRKSPLGVTFETALQLFPDLWTLTSSDTPEMFVAKVLKPGYPLLKFDTHHGFMLDQKVKNKLPDNDIDITRLLKYVKASKGLCEYKSTFLIAMSELLSGLATHAAKHVTTLYNFQVDRDLVQPPLFKKEEFAKFAASVEGYKNMEMSASGTYANVSLEDYTDKLMRSVAKYLGETKKGISKSLQEGLVSAHALKLQVSDLLAGECGRSLKIIPEDTSPGTNYLITRYAEDGYKLFNVLPADVRFNKHDGVYGLSLYGEVVAMLPFKLAMKASGYTTDSGRLTFGAMLGVSKNVNMGSVTVYLGRLTASLSLFTGVKGFEGMYRDEDNTELRDYGIEWTAIKKDKGRHQSTLSTVLGKINSVLPFMFMRTNYSRSLHFSFGTGFFDSLYCGETQDFKEAIFMFESRLEGLLGKHVSVRKFLDRFSIGKYKGSAILADIVQNKRVTLLDDEGSTVNETLGEVYITVPLISSKEPWSTVHAYTKANEASEDRARLYRALDKTSVAGSLEQFLYDKPMADEYILKGVTVALVRGVITKRTMTTDSWVGSMLGLEDWYSSYYINFEVVNSRTCSARATHASAFLKDLNHETIVSTVRDMLVGKNSDMVSTPVVAYDVDMSALKFNTEVAWTADDHKLR